MAQMIERQLTHRAAARSVSGLAAVLAHEIKNPLSGIRGAAQLLESERTDSDRTLTQLICAETDRIRKLVDRMEVFGDERPLQREPVNIHDVLDHVKQIARNRLRPAIRIVENYDPSLPPVPGNRDKLIQVYLNLVKNAAEAIGEERADGQHHAHARPSVPACASPCRGAKPASACRSMIAVEDNGSGVPDRSHAASVRSLRHHQAVRHRARLGPRRQDHRRPRRHHRMRLASPGDHLSRADADGRERSSAKRARGRAHGQRQYPHRRRRRCDPHRAQPGARPRRLRAARDRQRRHAVALGQPGRGRRRHHRRA